MIGEILNLGKQIYDTSNPRELHRLIVFLGRSLIHYPAMKKLWLFFQEDEQRRKILEKNPFPMEQVTRAFFYAGSTIAEREKLIMAHYTALEEKLRPEWFDKLTRQYAAYTIWQSVDEDIDWKAQLFVEPGQRKEGLMAVVMRLNNQHLYQIMFWLAPDKMKNYRCGLALCRGQIWKTPKRLSRILPNGRIAIARRISFSIWRWL